MRQGGKACRYRALLAAFASAAALAALPVTASAAPGTITTVAGNGTAALTGDGGPATSASLNHPQGVVAAPDGGYYIADNFNHVVRKVDPDGTIHRYAGTGTQGYSGDGGPATSARLNFPRGLAVAGDGSLLIADTNNSVIRKVAPDGTITTVVGIGPGSAGFNGDGLAATSTALCFAGDVAVTSDGGLLVADTCNHRIRKVSPLGIVSTVAGNGTQGPGGDGGPATSAQLNFPQGVAVLPGGWFGIADTDDNKVRVVDSTGTIHTAAGTGAAGGGGDGRSGNLAELRSPQGLDAAPDGTLLIADSGNHRVRQVSPTGGAITTVAGTGTKGFSGDGGPATAARLSEPYAVAERPNGDLLIAENGNHRIRRVEAPPVAGGTFYVNSTADTDDFACDAAPGDCTLREAIHAADATTGPSTIAFSIGLGGPQTINVTSSLPQILKPVTVDGTTQPGFAGQPLIEVSGSAGTGGLVTSSGVTIRSLVVNGFASAGITVGGGQNTVEGCYVGTTADGLAAKPNALQGIIVASPGNTIGGTTAAQRNVISGNGGSGVLVNGFGAPASGNRIVGNYIGVDAAGTGRLANGSDGVTSRAAGLAVGGTAPGERNVISGNALNGVSIEGDSTQGTNTVAGNYIGTNAAGTAAVPNLRGVSTVNPGNTIGPANVIAGNAAEGLQLVGSPAHDNTVKGNLIGTVAAGTSALGNGGDGVVVKSGAGQNQIGGTVAADRNVISGSGGNGVSLPSSANTVTGNYIGTTAAGTAAAGNAIGVLVTGPGNTVNGNVISGNRAHGVQLDGDPADGNTVAGNFVGTEPTGNAGVGNGQSGVVVSGRAENNLIGGATTAARNVIAGNGRPDVAGNGSGVLIDTTGNDIAHNNRVLGNYIGIKANGRQPLGNEGDGVLLGDGNNQVGGSAAGEGNVVSGNGDTGIRLSTGTDSVLGNKIGTDPTGAFAVANNTAGVAVTSPNNVIGDGTAGGRNVISGNLNEGIWMSGGSASSNTIQGNFVGTDLTGERRVGNGTAGIAAIDAPANLIGGASSGQGNVVSGNGQFGVDIFRAGSSGNRVLGNRIGTDDDGEQPIGNGLSGVLVQAVTRTTVGGPSSGERNVISANGEAGIFTYQSPQTTIRGNYIGTDGDGNQPLGNKFAGLEITDSTQAVVGGAGAGEGNLVGSNSGWGVVIDGSSTFGSIAGNSVGAGIGGVALGNGFGGVSSGVAGPLTVGGIDPGAANTLAYNHGPGLGTYSSTAGTVLARGNSIYSNDGLGIDLGIDGRDTNDALDADTGTNGRQNYPGLTLATSGGGTTTVRGSLGSKPDQTYVIDFYSDTACDLSGNAEGRTYLGSASVTTNGMGIAGIAETLSTEVPAGQVVTATATDSSGNTSEFSPCRPVTGAPAASVGDVTVPENGGSATVPVTLSGPSARTVTVDYATVNGSAEAGSDYASTSGTVTFSPGETSKDVTVPITDDTVDEPDETFRVALSNPGEASIGDGQGDVTITDDDAAPALSVGDASVTEGTGGTSDLTFPVTLSAASGKTVTVDADTADGSAQAPGDYSSRHVSVTFAPGETSKDVTVPVVTDSLDESDETLTVALANESNATVARRQATGTIADDDGQPSVSVGDVNVAEGGGNASVPVTLDAPSAHTVTVDYATADGSAAAGSDYTAATGTLTFAPGETAKQVTVPVTDDTLDEPDEGFTVGLSNASQASIGDASGAVTITDNDAPPDLSVADVSTPEGTGGSNDATFAVSLSAPSGKTVTVDGDTSDGTATAPADYTARHVSLTFAPGETTKNVAVPLVTDGADEDDETLGLALSNESNAGVARRHATGTIVDDDGTPGISIDDVRVAEGTGSDVNADFTVSLSKPSRRTTSVRVATADGSATAGSDYTAVDTTVTFAPGETAKTVSVGVTGDSADEPEETFAARLSDPVHGVVTRGEGTATIVDDDETPLPPPQPPEQRDTQSPALTLDGLARRLTRPVLLHDGVSFGVTADEAASLDIQLIARPRWLRAARSGDIVIARKKWPLAGGRRAVKIKVLPKLRRRFTHGRADLRLTVLATDAAGNRTRLTKPLTIR